MFRDNKDKLIVFVGNAKENLQQQIEQVQRSLSLMVTGHVAKVLKMQTVWDKVTSKELTSPEAKIKYIL